LAVKTLKWLFLIMFYLGGVGLACFLTLLLLSKSKKTGADKILACWLLVMTVHLLFFYFRKMELYPQLLGIDMPLPLFHGPFLYLYTLALTQRLRSVGVSLLHFIPPLAVFLYLIPFLVLPVEQKVFVYDNKGVGYETFNLIRTIAVIISGVLYVILSSLVLRKHRISIADQFSNTEKINLQWLQYLIYWIAVIWILVIVSNDYWIFGATVLFILFIGFFGVRQVGIFHSPQVSSDKEEVNVSTDELETQSAEKRKYQKSGLSQEGSALLHRQLGQVMTDEKLYRESELSLADLAVRLNTQPNYLSQVINEREGKNFYDYVNTLRIQEFKRVAAKPESRKYTLLALAEQCGFNSKSSFNRYFKKVTGQSPSEFMLAFSDTEK
jgi:AraC-like DNA-binding protein